MARCGYCGTRKNVGQYGQGGTAEYLCGAHRKMQRAADRGKGATSPRARSEPAVRSRPCPNNCGRTMPDGVHCPGPYC